MPVRSLLPLRARSLDEVLEASERRFYLTSASAPFPSQFELYSRLFAILSADNGARLESLVQSHQLTPERADSFKRAYEHQFAALGEGVCFGLSALFAYYRLTDRKDVFFRQMQKLTDASYGDTELLSDDELMRFFSGVIFFHNRTHSIDDKYQFYLSGLKQCQLERSAKALGDFPVFHLSSVLFKLTTSSDLLVHLSELLSSPQVINNQVVITLNNHCTTFFVSDSNKVEYYDPNAKVVLSYNLSSPFEFKSFVHNVATAHLCKALVPVVGIFELYSLKRPSDRTELMLGSLALNNQLFCASDLDILTIHIFYHLDCLSKKDIAFILSQIAEGQIQSSSIGNQAGIVLAALICGDHEILRQLKGPFKSVQLIHVAKYLDIIFEVFSGQKAHGQSTPFIIKPSIDESAISIEALEFIKSIIKCIPFEIDHSLAGVGLLPCIVQHNHVVRGSKEVGLLVNFNAITADATGLVALSESEPTLIKLSDENVELVFSFLSSPWVNLRYAKDIFAFDTSLLTDKTGFHKKLSNLLITNPIPKIVTLKYNSYAYKLYSDLKSKSVISCHFCDLFEDDDEKETVRKYWESSQSSMSFTIQESTVIQRFLNGESHYFYASSEMNPCLYRLYDVVCNHELYSMTFENFIIDFESLFGVAPDSLSFDKMGQQSVHRSLVVPLTPASTGWVMTLLENGEKISLRILSHDTEWVFENLSMIASRQYPPSALILSSENVLRNPEHDGSVAKLICKFLPNRLPNIYVEDNSTHTQRLTVFDLGLLFDGDLYECLELIPYEESTQSLKDQSITEAWRYALEDKYVALDDLLLFYNAYIHHSSNQNALYITSVFIKYFRTHSVRSGAAKHSVVLKSLEIIKRMVTPGGEGAQEGAQDYPLILNCFCILIGNLYNATNPCLDTADFDFCQLYIEELYKGLGDVFVELIRPDDLLKLLATPLSQITLKLAGQSYQADSEGNLGRPSLNIIQWLFQFQPNNLLAFLDVFKIDHLSIIRMVHPHFSLFEYSVANDLVGTYFSLMKTGLSPQVTAQLLKRSASVVNQFLKAALVHLTHDEYKALLRRHGVVCLPSQFDESSSCLLALSHQNNQQDGTRKLKMIVQAGVVSISYLFSKTAMLHVSQLELLVTSPLQFLGILSEALQCSGTHHSAILTSASTVWPRLFGPVLTATTSAQILNTADTLTYLLLIKRLPKIYKIAIADVLVNGLYLNFYAIFRKTLSFDESHSTDSELRKVQAQLGLDEEVYNQWVGEFVSEALSFYRQVKPLSPTDMYWLYYRLKFLLSDRAFKIVAEIFKGPVPAHPAIATAMTLTPCGLPSGQDSLVASPAPLLWTLPLIMPAPSGGVQLQQTDIHTLAVKP